MTEETNQREKRKKILMIDDNKMSLMKVQKWLEPHFDFIQTSEPLEAIKLVNSQKPHLILLDVIMPKVSGLELLSQMRKNYSNFELPVILFSGKEDSEDIIEGLKLGANDYVVKAANVEILLARIQTQLSLRDLYFESLKSGELDVINNMVTTLSHEINNPLAIVYGNLSILKSQFDSPRFDKCLKSLDRISEIIKRIEKVVKDGNMDQVEKSNYSSSNELYVFKKSS